MLAVPRETNGFVPLSLLRETVTIYNVNVQRCRVQLINLCYYSQVGFLFFFFFISISDFTERDYRFQSNDYLVRIVVF